MSSQRRRKEVSLFHYSLLVNWSCVCPLPRVFSCSDESCLSFNASGFSYDSLLMLLLWLVILDLTGISVRMRSETWKTVLSRDFLIWMNSFSSRTDWKKSDPECSRVSGTSRHCESLSSILTFRRPCHGSDKISIWREKRWQSDTDGEMPYRLYSKTYAFWLGNVLKHFIPFQG